MPFSDVEAKTSFTGFSASDEAAILGVFRTAYNGSAIAKAMFDSYLATAGNTINVQFRAGAFKGPPPGNLILDLGFLADNTYITPTGKVVEDTLLSSIVHELGHALTSRFDDNDNVTDYAGANVRFVNGIYDELGIPQQVSYIAYDSTGRNHIPNFEYTNGNTIDRAVTVETTRSSPNWNSSAAGNSRDLLIGGSANNRLHSGNGNDFLFGGGGDDDLHGGGGNGDTAVFVGKPTDYDIRLNSDGTWTSRHVRSAADEGTDKITNIEKVQFQDGETFNLKKKGLTFQTDFAFVIDTTGSMGDDIDAVKSQANTIINRLFRDDKVDARIGIVGFKDAAIGEPTSVILPFTDQDQFAERKTEALAAINGISVSGGGDLPETSFDGLLKALDGTMGDWRPGAGTHRVVLFTDASAKDGSLASRVANLAANIGATITRSSSRAVGENINRDAFTLSLDSATQSFGRDVSTEPETDIFPPFVPTDEPPEIDTSLANLEIFTILTGSGGVDTSDLEAIADVTGGSFIEASTPDDLVETVLEIIELPPDGPTDGRETFNFGDGPDIGIGTEKDETFNGGGGNDRLLGAAGDDVLNGEAGNDRLLGGDGNDTLDGGEGEDTLLGESGQDELLGGSDDDLLLGGSDDDELSGGDGNDTILGESGNDTILGENGSDRLLGGDGNDTLDGGEGTNILLGESGDDLLTGGNARDVLIGGGGSDRLEGGNGANVLKGGSGSDTLIGGDQRDRLLGGGGNDELFGGADIDRLSGGFGNDLLVGEGGRDFLNGGAGIDTFVLSFDADADIIQDFEVGIDLIGLSGGISFGDLSLQRGRSDLFIRYEGQTLAKVEDITSLGESSFIAV